MRYTDQTGREAAATLLPISTTDGEGGPTQDTGMAHYQRLVDEAFRQMLAADDSAEPATR